MPKLGTKLRMRPSRDMVEAQGIKLPSKGRAYRCDANGRLMADKLMVSIDVSGIHLT